MTDRKAVFVLILGFIFLILILYMLGRSTVVVIYNSSKESLVVKGVRAGWAFSLIGMGEIERGESKSFFTIFGGRESVIEVVTEGNGSDLVSSCHVKHDYTDLCTVHLIKSPGGVIVNCEECKNR